MIFKTEIKVRGYHLDLYQHVNNARFLEFMEEGRWDMIDRYGIMDDFFTQNLGFAVVNININYKSPAVLDDVLEVRTRIKEFSAYKGIIEQIIVKKATQQVVTEADVIYVIVNLKSNKVGALDANLMDKFAILKAQENN